LAVELVKNAWGSQRLRGRVMLTVGCGLDAVDSGGETRRGQEAGRVRAVRGRPGHGWQRAGRLRRLQRV